MKNRVARLIMSKKHRNKPKNSPKIPLDQRTDRPLMKFLDHDESIAYEVDRNGTWRKFKDERKRNKARKKAENRRK